MPRPVRSSVVSIDGGKPEARSGPERDGNRSAASLAHEINNPLESLLSLLCLLQADTTLSDQSRQYLVFARQEAKRISQIAHTAMQKLHNAEGLTDTNLPHLLSSIVDFYKARFESQGIAVNSRYCLDGTLAVYPTSLRQAFSSLLLNASDAMPNGGNIQVRVAIAHEWSGQNRQGVRVTVADCGCGINEDDIADIWQSYFTTKGAAGNGIGLSLVKETVEKHGGKVRVWSSTREGHSGTVFTMFLPGSLNMSE